MSYVIPYACFMSNTITATDARAKLYNLLTEVNTSHMPITITGKSGNAVLVSEDDWNALMEQWRCTPFQALWKTSTPGEMNRSIPPR